MPVADIVGTGTDGDDKMMDVLYPLGALLHLLQIDIKLGRLQRIDFHQLQRNGWKRTEQTVLLIQKLGHMKAVEPKFPDDLLQKRLIFQNSLITVDNSLFKS